jgi:hypothetical protein
MQALGIQKRIHPVPPLATPDGRVLYPKGIGFPVFPVTYPDIFYFFLRSLIADKLPKEEKIKSVPNL